MAKRRRKRTTPSVHRLRKQLDKLKKGLPHLPHLPKAAPKVPRLPHSSVFVTGIGIGLLAGVAIGLTFAWVDTRHRTSTKPTQVAAVTAPPKVIIEPAPAPTPATTAPAPTPPAYVEQTEPQPDDDAGNADDSAAMNQLLNQQPPVAATPQPPAPPPFTPEPQPADPAAALPAAPTPAWLKNAVASVDPGAHPMIAIVLDDVGAAPGDAPGAVALPAPITLSIMTYAPNAARLADQARKAGHEIMVHVPMEAINRDADPGKNALLVGLSPQELQQRLDWDPAQFEGYVGINNHMGSRFTQDASGMQLVLQTLKARGLLFLDSRTIASSVGDTLAGQLGVTHLKRNVFLDDVIEEADIRKELAKTEAIAKKQGFAIAIGHPHPATVAALKQWIPEAKARGFVLVPITAIAKKQFGVTG